MKKEIEWINRNTHKYDSPLHAKSVIANIQKRYRIKSLTESINRFQNRGTTGNMFKMFDLINKA